MAEHCRLLFLHKCACHLTQYVRINKSVKWNRNQQQKIELDCTRNSNKIVNGEGLVTLVKMHELD